MKKLINSKKAVQKILIAIISAILINFIVPTYSRAVDLGGILSDPIVDFLAMIGDVVVAGLQKFMVDGDFGDGSTMGVGTGSFLNAFLLSAEEYQASVDDGSYSDKYPEIYYGGTEDGVSARKFNSEDIDKGLVASLFDSIGLTDESLNFGIPVTKYSPEKIFSGSVPALDINFISPKDWGDEDLNKHSIANSLHETIASWYVAIRNLTVVGLMIVLVYVGIRMVLSSTASDKAKYKQMILDWLVAMCLVFFLHYIMAFTITVTDEITKALSGKEKDYGNKIPVVIYDSATTDESTGVVTYGSQITSFRTDLMGLARFQIQLNGAGDKWLYTIIYLALVIYTVIFTWTYLKRVIMMAFLTLVSPLVALTYPIDKIGDGKAQAFNMWLKEYIFNALLQPFHLIIYTVFVGTAMDLAVSNPIYAIVVLAFIKPAEKILRRFFGFEKASTAGSLSSFAGGALAYKGLSTILNRGAKGGKGGQNNSIRQDKKPAIKDPNAPSGVDGFSDVPLGGGNDQSPEELPPPGGNPPLEGAPGEGQPALPTGTGGERGAGELGAGERGAGELGAGEQPPTPIPGADSAREAMEEQQRLDEMARLREELNDPNRDYADMYLDGQRQARLAELEEQQRQYEQSRQQPIASQPNPVPLPNSDDEESDNGSEDSQQTESPSPDSRPQPTPTPIHTRAIRGIKGAAKSTVGNKIWRRNFAKGVAKVGIRAATTLGTGAVGVAAGITGENLEDIAKYGAGGAVLGATVGADAVSSIPGRVAGVGRAVKNSAPVQGFIGGWTGQTTRERAVQRQAQELRKDDTFREQMSQYQPEGRDQTEKELDVTVERGIDYYQAGITDSSDIISGLELEDSISKDLETNHASLNEQQRRDLAKTQAITATKMAKQIQDPTKLTDEKYVSNLTKSWAKKIQKKNSALSAKQAEENAKQIMRRVKQIHKIG